MGSPTSPRDKAAAVLQLAAGQSQASAAVAAGVSSGTVARWRRDPVFAAEVERTRAVWERRPHDAEALVAHLESVERALAPRGPVTVEGGRFKVTVSVAHGASARSVERLTARSIARGLRALRQQGGL